MPATTTDAVRSRWLRHSGRTLHQLDWGGDHPVVLCLHGVTSCAWVWHHVARHLTGSHRVVAADLRGHGASSWAPAGAYGTADHATDVAAVVADLGCGPLDVVGSSWGALVGVALAAHHPDVVRRLVMVDIEPASTAAVDDVPIRPAQFGDLDAAVAWWGQGNPHAPADLLEVVAAGATRPGPGGVLVPAHDPVFATSWPFRAEDWWPALDKIAAPTLVVNAGSSWVRAEVCDEMAGRLARAERLEVAESTHVVPVDAPDALGSALAEFLGGGG